MSKILSISGSLRKESLNGKLSHIAVKEAVALGADAEVINLIDYDIPIFNEDLEAIATPEGVLRLKEKMLLADGFIICNPEYNGSISSPMKNLIDWMSRPTPEGKRALQNKKIALLATSPGSLGGLRALPHLRDIFTSVGSFVIPKQAAFGGAYDLLKDGEMTDVKKRKLLQDIIQELIQVIDSLK